MGAYISEMRRTKNKSNGSQTRKMKFPARNPEIYAPSIIWGWSIEVKRIVFLKTTQPNVKNQIHLPGVRLYTQGRDVPFQKMWFVSSSIPAISRLRESE